MANEEFNWDKHLLVAPITDKGMRRANNQDAHRVVPASSVEDWKKRGHLYIVADGMGAHAAGELASKLAADSIPHLYKKYAEHSPPEALQRSVVETNAEIHRRGQANSDFRNMGTTGSVLLLLPQGALIAHIGDSRIYRFRGDRLEQLTRDHSLIWELRELGQISENGDIAHAVPKNVITRSLGPNPHVETDIEGPWPIEQGDTFLLCSDGLTAKIEDHELAAMLAYLPPDEAASLFVNLANLRGGPDNITAIVVKVVGPQLVTGNDNDQPITIGSPSARKPASPLIWVGVAVCLLAAPVLLMTHNPLFATISAVAGALFAVLGVVNPQRSPRPGISLAGGKRLGRGPYTTTICPAEEEVVSLLGRITRDLRKSVEQQEFEIDLGEFDGLCAEAERAESSRRPRDAVLDRARAIRVLMQAVRDEQNRNASDSAIEH